MIKGGSIAAFVLSQIEKQAKPSVKTIELDQIARRIIAARGAEPAFLNYNGFPGATCISINDEVVHGIPGQRKLKKGDLVKIDLGVKFDGYNTDTAKSFVVGKPNNDQQNIISGVLEALNKTIQIAKDGVYVGDLENMTGTVLKSYNLSPVMQLSGHGIGEKLHEDPSIKSDGITGKGSILKEGMALAIEPMATSGMRKVYTAKDGWTILSQDGSLAAHFEHTILITKGRAKILTQLR